MKASECERTGVVAHICRNKVWYITGTGVAVVGSVAATWWCCYKKTQEVRDGFFAKVGGPDADLITLLSNTDAKGNDKQIKNILSKFFKVNNGALESNNSAKAIDFLAKLKDWKNDKFSTPNGYYNDYYNNPYWERDNNRFNTRNYNFNSNFKLDYKATSALTFTGRVAIAQTNTTQTTTSNNYTYSAFSKTGGFVNYYSNDYDLFLTGRGKFISRSTPIPGSNGESQSTGSRLTFDAFGVHDKKFTNISLKTILGFQASVRRTKGISASTSSLGVSGLYNLSNSATGLFNASNSESQTRKIGGYADVTVGIKEILFLHGTARTDFTSVFSGPAIGYNDPQFNTYGGDVSFIVSDLIPSIKNKENNVMHQNSQMPK